MNEIPLISAESLGRMLRENEAVNILDIRPLSERMEWFIPGSIHIDAYARLKQNDTAVLDNLHLDKSIPVVTVCAGGKTSLIAADILQQKGYKASSLQNGMKGWGMAWNTAHRSFTDFEVWQVRRTGKGCLSYIIASGKEAIIIDASLPLEVYVGLINQHHLSVKYVIETHIHADHLSRSKEIAAYFQALLFLPIPNKVEFTYNKITTGSAFSLGATTLQTLPTPGHTMESISLYIRNSLVFTGDTLFTNGVGRPDLKASEAESLHKAALLYESLKQLLSLPDEVLVLPAHTSQPIDFDGKMVSTTIGEAKKNVLLLRSEKDDFINSLLQKIPATPPNYLSIVEKNLAGDFSGIDPLELEAGANHCAVS